MLTLDLETKSYADLTKVGQQAYAEHPTTKVIVCSYGIETEPIQSWCMQRGHDPECPEDLAYAIKDGMPVEAHNAAFEIAHFNEILGPQFGWPVPPIDQWRDTMATACYYCLPASLDKLCRAIRMEGKDPEGNALITKYSKLYLKTAKERIPDGSDEDWVTWSKMTAKEKIRCPWAQQTGGMYRDDLQLFIDYCERDVLLEQSVSEYLGDLPDREQKLWHIDMRINLRGLRLDLEGIEAATEVVTQRADDYTQEFRRLTGLNPTQRDKVLQWFHGQGLPLENLQKKHLEEVDEDWDIPQGPARRALKIRLAINKASTKKLDAMARQVSRDGTAKFQTRYHGAGTGRDTGTGFQPLNLVRSWEDVPPEELVHNIVRWKSPRWLDFLYGDAMEAVSKAGRHWIVAGDGEEIVAGDYVSVEAIVLACLAGEEWKVEAFREGKKIYELMGDKIHGLPEGTVTKATHPLERQDGKTGELAFGYQGALNAWLNFDDSGRHTDERIIEICKAWRAQHPATVASWYGSQDAMLDAVASPGTTTGYRDLGFQIKDEWLTMILPDGKRLWYYDPKIQMRWPQWHQPAVKEECATLECGHKKVPQVTYMAYKFGAWRRVSTYGGKVMENATQAVSRQLLTYAIERLEGIGFPIVLKVYDEIVGRPKKGFITKEDFEGEMVDPLQKTFAASWPISADAWIGPRYKK